MAAAASHGVSGGAAQAPSSGERAALIAAILLLDPELDAAYASARA